MKADRVRLKMIALFRRLLTEATNFELSVRHTIPECIPARAVLLFLEERKIALKAQIVSLENSVWVDA